MRAVVVYAKKQPRGDVRLIVTDNAKAIQNAGHDPIFQADSVWVDLGGVVCQLFVKEGPVKKEDTPKDAQEKRSIDDLESFCRSRMDTTKHPDMKMAYRDVLYLVRQHKNLIERSESNA